MLLSAINLAYYQDLMAGMREAIAQGRFADFCAATREGWARGDIPPLLTYACAEALDAAPSRAQNGTDPNNDGAQRRRRCKGRRPWPST